MTFCDIFSTQGSIYIYIHTCIRIIHTRIIAWIRACIQTYIQAYLDTCMHVRKKCKRLTDLFESLYNSSSSAQISNQTNVFG